MNIFNTAFIVIVLVVINFMTCNSSLTCGSSSTLVYVDGCYNLNDWVKNGEIGQISPEYSVTDDCVDINWQYDLTHSFTASYVSAATDGTVVALDSNGNAYMRISDNDAIEWKQLSEPYATSDFRAISVGKAEEIWAINQWGRGYRYNNENDVWTSISNPIFREISAASDGSIIVGIGTDNKIYKRPTGGDSWNFAIYDNAHSWEYVSVGSEADGMLWATNYGGGRAYQFDDLSVDESHNWIGCSPTACFKQLSVGSDGTVIAVDTSNLIYYRSGNKWKQICANGGEINKISVVTQDNIWAIINDRIAIAHF